MNGFNPSYIGTRNDILVLIPNAVEKYDWNIIAEQYEPSFRELVNKGIGE